MTSTHSASAAAAPLGFAASTVTLRPACTPCGIRVPHPCPEAAADGEPCGHGECDYLDDCTVSAAAPPA